MNDFFSKHKLGLFIHWGIYAVGGWHEQTMGRLCIPRAEYEKYAAQFNPTEYDPDKWVETAQNAGFSYICFTAKHHDGFCMWDSDQTDYKVTNTPYGRDTLAMLADACQRHGIALSIYYSNPDWHHPNAYNAESSHQLPPESGDVPDLAAYREYIKRQLTELLTHYGKISQLFWDIPPVVCDPSLNELARKLQPDILINDRGWSEGDYGTPERGIPGARTFTRATEACQSISRESWGFRAHDDYYTPAFLTRSVGAALAMGGSYLLNIGPDAKGNLGKRGEQMLKAVGDWYSRVKCAFGEPVSLPEVPEDARIGDTESILINRRGNTLYLHFRTPLESTGIRLPFIQTRPVRAYVVNDGTELPFDIACVPSLCSIGTLRPEVLHLWDIPAERFTQETPVIALEFDTADIAFAWRV